MEMDQSNIEVASGAIVPSKCGELAFRVIKKVGHGRCCVVYSGVSVFDGSPVALKFYKQGPDYEAALKRERFVLDRFSDPQHNLVTFLAYINYRGLHCLVMELLHLNIRQIIYKNERRGLSPWASLKFAQDILVSLFSLHSGNIVHGDLKPGNVLWSSQDGVFKVIDFGLSFVREEDVHQVQSEGYRAPETKTWNKWKEMQSHKRRRKLQGSFSRINLTNVTRDFSSHLNDDRKQNLDSTVTEAVPEQEEDKHVRWDLSSYSGQSSEQSKPHSIHHSDSQTSGIFSQEGSDRSQCSSRLSCDTERGHQEAGPGEEESLRYLEATLRMEQRIVQDWRRNNRHSAIYDDRPLEPPAPGLEADIWSYGCLLAEVMTGRKLFQAGDKLASVLRPSQLLEMKLGDTEVLWAERGQGKMFRLFKDLILQCIRRERKDRITAERALSHPVFLESPDPSMRDLFLLPSPHLQFSQFSQQSELGGTGKSGDNSKQILDDLKVECSAYGEIRECTLADGGHAFIHFEEEAWLIF